MSLSSSVRRPRRPGTRAVGPCPAVARCRKHAAAPVPAGYSINSILYQRGIYPPETFRRVNKYGLTMLVTTDDALNAYLENVLTQLSRAPPASPTPPAWAPAHKLPTPQPALVASAVLDAPWRARAEWLAAGSVQKLVVVVTGQQTLETLERWVFDVHTDKSIGPEGKVGQVATLIPSLALTLTAHPHLLPPVYLMGPPPSRL